MPRAPMKASVRGLARAPKKTSPKQLNREIAMALVEPPRGDDDAGMARITRDRVHESLIGERITRSDPVYVSLIADHPEEWKLVFTRGKNYGGAYRSEVSPELVVVGPFTRAGRAAAERAGATIEE